MNYLVFVFICVLIIIPLAWATEYFHKKKVKLCVFSESHKKAAKWENLYSVAVIVVFVFMLSSPAIYEFKPWACDTQYEIIHNGEGKIACLKKDATGFHAPFSSGSKFVCLPDKMSSLKVIKDSMGGFSFKEVSIQCIASCDRYPNAFIKANGLFAKNFHFSIFGETRPGFINWVYEDFYRALRASFIAEKVVLLNTPADVYVFVCKEAEKWNSTNPYGCKIDVKQP